MAAPARIGCILVAGIGLVISTGVGHAQLPGVTQEVTAEGTLDYTDLTGGPADVYMGTIRIDVGARYGGWHTHPGPVLVVVTSGDLALYGPDGCRVVYPTGTAYVAQPEALYDLRNEGVAPVVLAFTGVIPADQPPTVFADGPAGACGQ